VPRSQSATRTTTLIRVGVFICVRVRQSDAMSSVVLRVYDLRYVRRTTDDG